MSRRNRSTVVDVLALAVCALVFVGVVLFGVNVLLDKLQSLPNIPQNTTERR